MKPQLICEAPGPDEIQKRTVQEYIDETPIWSDGTESPYTPMTPHAVANLGIGNRGQVF